MRGFQKSLAVAAASVVAAGTLLAAQTPIKLPKNNYTPEQDVELGMKAAAEVRKQYPIIKDEPIAKYLTGLGDRLVVVAPSNLKQPVYKYSFTAVNLKEINAFALPGGPMFVHRGMFDAAAVEGEVVGVMAHELAHVLLRHGTANATKAQNPWLQLGAIAGQIGGAMVGGNTGALIADGTGFGLGTLMLRYSRDFEKQADLLGSQIMAKAGYDPRDLAHMFETIAGESKGGAPQWMSSHPNPGNRTQYITKEAQALKIEGKADTSGFPVARKNFAGLPPAMTMAELAKRGPGGSGDGAAGSVGTPGKPVPAPSSQMRTINAGVFQASVPGNWKNLESGSTIKVVPENGYGEMKGETVFTHGVEFGVAKASSRDLKEATAAWLKAVAQANPELREAGDSQYVKMSGRTALNVPLTNPSPLGGTEQIELHTTILSSGELFYFFSVVPEADARTYQPVFYRIAQSIKIKDVR